ncbi:MAG: hypothetical protein L0H73_02595 [Nitrococcus sp.]|nr:hypothetical protein [Nitrococcus sp.]
MTEASIEELLEKCRSADTDTRQQVAQVLLDRVDGNPSAWVGVDIQALSRALAELGTERALNACIVGLGYYAKIFSDQLDQLDPRYRATVSCLRADASYEIGKITGDTAAIRSAIVNCDAAIDILTREAMPNGRATPEFTTQQLIEVQRRVDSQGTRDAAEIPLDRVEGALDECDEPICIYRRKR